MLRLDMDKVRKRARSKGAESIPDIAEKSGVDKATLYRLASRDMEPSLTTAWRLAAFLGARIESIVHEDPQATRRPSVPRQRKAPARRRRAT